MSDSPLEPRTKPKEKQPATDKKRRETIEGHKRKYSYQQYDKPSKQSGPSPRKDEFCFQKSSQDRVDMFPASDLFAGTLSKSRSAEGPETSGLTMSNDLRCFKIVSKGNIIHDQSIYDSDGTHSTRGSQSNDGDSPDKQAMGYFSRFATSSHSIAPSSKGISMPSFLGSM
eukprot:CAMPEP_0176429126 /NCGR_PEP_ID=MMETSP0127-20121128/13537_1 /TAXON_ID=938130 /ORGANISM="Platyophrya macrostoma, Strain WH" /LENGTH=169 /DNA_ID=CAMNT_0017810895 /DNA_START=140 /DNA_END=649 /DNA_ORIENTATION=-